MNDDELKDFVREYLDECVAVEGAVALAELVRRERAAEREVCLALVKKYLVFDSQRAVAWHEVRDLLTAVRVWEGRP